MTEQELDELVKKLNRRSSTLYPGEMLAAAAAIQSLREQVKGLERERDEWQKQALAWTEIDDPEQLIAELREENATLKGQFDKLREMAAQAIQYIGKCYDAALKKAPTQETEG